MTTNGRATQDVSPRVYCVECGAETETDCICDDLNYADGDRIIIDGEVYIRYQD